MKMTGCSNFDTYVFYFDRLKCKVRRHFYNHSIVKKCTAKMF